MPTQTQTCATDAGPDTGPAPQPTLVLIQHPNAQRIGERLTLQSNVEVVIGRASPRFGGEPLSDSRVSSRHVSVCPVNTDEGMRLRFADQNSKNGVLIAGSKQTSGELSEGDILQIGDSFVFFALEEPFPRADSDTLLGSISARMHRLRSEVAIAASQSAPVMIVGPSGCGKERVARELHRLARTTGEFVPVNCATLSEQLAESELFGHTKGAFTGASSDKEGLFVRANGGTLFLDEVATIPPSVQPKFLRAIQEGEVRPVGTTRAVACRPRIVCATNEDLQQMVVDGQFREDLYARLLGSLIDVPSLSDRREDIGYLSNLLMPRVDGQHVRLATELTWAFLDHPWPLNVRSLEQCLRSHVGEADSGVLRLSPSLQHFLDSQREFARKRDGSSVEPQAPVPTAKPKSKPKRARVSKPDKSTFESVLRANDGSVERVATELGVRRQQIYRWLDAHGLDIDDFRA
jgi:DNA-binding NtrC family response regulator